MLLKTAKKGDVKPFLRNFTSVVNVVMNSSSAWLSKQMKEAKSIWIKNFKNVKVLSSQDMIDRYSLIADTRLKLSTLAHFWNFSSQDERLQVFKYHNEI